MVDDGWVRSTANNPNNSGFFGSAQMITVTPGQTVLRSWWNISMYYLAADVTQYPPGHSILRVGLLYDDAGIPPLNRPTPITNADADWMAISTLNPNIVDLSREVNVAWQINWGFHIDLSVKSQRKNSGVTDKTLYICWEFGLSGQVAGFTIPGWWCSLDSYIRTP